MNKQTMLILGLVALVAGAVLAFMGYQERDSIANSFTSAFTGEYTDSTTQKLYGGGALALVGLALVALSQKKS